MEDDPGDTRFLVENLARSGQGLALRYKEDPKARSVLRGYINYLLGENPKSYSYLTDYLGWWGKEFLWDDIQHLLRGRIYDQAIELGPGTGWLLKLMQEYAYKRIGIDKRWALVERSDAFSFIVQDMELSPAIDIPLEVGSQRLIIANQFLHCVDNKETLVRINRADWLVIELASDTWMKQIRDFGATPMTGVDVEMLFRMNGYSLIDRIKSTVVVLSLWKPV